MFSIDRAYLEVVLGNHLCIRNLGPNVSEALLHSLLSNCGVVHSCHLVMNRFSGSSQGVAFVEMSSVADARRSILRLNGYEYNGRVLSVKSSHARRSID